MALQRRHIRALDVLSSFRKATTSSGLVGRKGLSVWRSPSVCHVWWMMRVQPAGTQTTD